MSIDFASLIPGIVATAGGAYLQNRALREKKKRQDEINRSIQAMQKANVARPIADTQQFVNAEAPAARHAATASATADSLSGMTEGARIGQNWVPQNPVAGKNLNSPEYSGAQARRGAINTAGLDMTMKSLAAMRAPSITGADRAGRAMRLGTDINAANTDNADLSRAGAGAISSVGANPWQMYGGQAMSGAGAGLLTKAAIEAMKKPKVKP